MYARGAVHANSPRYRAERVTAYGPYRSLRSADEALVAVRTPRPMSFSMSRTVTLELTSITSQNTMRLLNRRVTKLFT